MFMKNVKKNIFWKIVKLAFIDKTVIAFFYLCSGVGGPNSEVGGPCSAVGGPSSGVGGPSSEVGGPSSGARGPSSGVGGPSSGARGQSSTHSFITLSQ